MSALLAISGVSKRFGALTAVDRVSLAIRPNEFFALLGPSGCGKTTLLRMLAGFETPDEGAITLGGADITRLAPNRRPLNMMFQSYALFPHMSVRGNVAYGLEMERLGGAEIRTRVDAILAATHLDGLAERRPEQLSGGQKQRVALARALVKRPKVLLLDEPLAALDRKLRTAMQLELKRLQHEVGIAFVVVTHDQEEALVMADRVAVLKDGRLLQCGPPREVYERPDNRFVAEFIGSMNFFPGTVAPGGVRVGETLVAAALPPDVAAGAKAVAAVRPERLRAFPGPDAATRVAGVVEAVAYQGLDQQIVVRTPLSDRPVLARLTASEAERRSFAAGTPVELGWDAADTRVFLD